MTVNLSGLVRCFCANTNRCNVRGHLLELPTRSCNKTTYLRLAGDAWQRRSIARKQLDKNSQHGGGTRQTYPSHPQERIYIPPVVGKLGTGAICRPLYKALPPLGCGWARCGGTAVGWGARNSLPKRLPGTRYPWPTSQVSG